MFFPLLSITLENLLERTISKMRVAKEMEALTIARLLVLEFSQNRELLEAKPGDLNEIDQRIMNLIWQKVTFNEVIEGIELIQGHSDLQGRRLTYLFYRREAPDLEPMSGPQKLMKKFSGAEEELLDGITSPETSDKNKLEVSVNLGPKEEGQMLLRYLPLHVQVSDEGAIFWGTAKIGADVSGLTALQALQDQEQNYLRKAIWLEIILSLIISGTLAVSILYLWARSLTEPLRTLSDVARSFMTTRPQEYNLWLDNLRRVDPRGQKEVAEVKETLMRLGKGIPRLGERLFKTEYQACLSRVLTRSLPAILGHGNSGSNKVTEDIKYSPEAFTKFGFLREPPDRLTKLETELADWQHFTLHPEEEWQAFELTPTLERAWRLVTTGLPSQSRCHIDVMPLPAVWGSPGYLAQALLLLLDYTVELLDAKGEMTCKAGALPAGGLQVTVEVSGPRFSPEDCQELLHPPLDDGQLVGNLGPALAAAIAQWHGGQLSAQPVDSSGIRFTLTLPPPPAGYEHGQRPN